MRRIHAWISLPFLRKAKILAARLHNPELTEWVDHELNGYRGDEQLPSYRFLPAQAKGTFMSPYGHQLRDTEIPASVLPSKFREYGTTVHLAHPISLFASLVANAKGRDQGCVNFPWPKEMALLYGSNLYRGMQCISAWQELPNRGAGHCHGYRQMPNSIVRT